MYICKKQRKRKKERREHSSLSSVSIEVWHEHSAESRARIITAVRCATSSLHSFLLPSTCFLFCSLPLGPWYCWNGAELFNWKHSFVSRLSLFHTHTRTHSLDVDTSSVRSVGWECVSRASQEEGGLEQWEVRSGVHRDLFGPALYPSIAVCQCHGQP